VASCSKTNVYEKFIRYGDAAVGRCDPAHSGPDPGADPQVVGRRELRIRPWSDRAGVRQIRLGANRSERFIGFALLLGGAFTAIEGLIRLLFGATP
jgi:hypothetical protein